MDRWEDGRKDNQQKAGWTEERMDGGTNGCRKDGKKRWDEGKMDEKMGKTEGRWKGRVAAKTDGKSDGRKSSRKNKKKVRMVGRAE